MTQTNPEIAIAPRFFRSLLGLPQGGLHAFRRGCNRRWKLAGIKPAVIRQQMGHSSERMTTLYSGEIPLDQVRAAFSGKLLEKMENEAAA
jgi:integrase